MLFLGQNWPFLNVFSCFWAFPFGSGFTFQSFCEGQKGFPLQSLTRILVMFLILVVFGRFPSGRALCCNLFVRSSQKGFPLQSLTRILIMFLILVVFGRFPLGRAFRCNLFVKGKKDFHFNP